MFLTPSPFAPPPFPLCLPYLPDTYFPHSKRSIIYRPYTSELDDVTPPENRKRPRLGPTPVEHEALSAHLKQERSSIPAGWQPKPGITAPLYVLKFLQAQGCTLNRTNEAMETLKEQVTDLTSKLERKLSDKKAPVSRPPPNRDGNWFPLLLSYHTIIRDAVEKFKRYGDSETSRSLVPWEKYKSVETVLECMSKIRELMVIQCNVDVCDSGHRPSIYPISNVSLTTGPRPTWDQVSSSLNAMERNLRSYINSVSTPNTRGRYQQPNYSSSVNEYSWGDQPSMTTRTPRSRAFPQPRVPQRKRKCEHLYAYESASTTTIPATRRKLNPKKLNFSFPSTSTIMEVD